MMNLLRDARNVTLTLWRSIYLILLLALCPHASSQYCGGACDPIDQTDCVLEGGLWHPYPGCYCTWKSPVILSLSKSEIRLTSVEGGVHFDLDADGLAEQTAWVAPNSDDVLLVLDRNGNGRIDNGNELFGNFTEQPFSPTKNGFNALAVFDQPDAGGNPDGVIDPNDRIFTSLRLWRDSNHNGMSEPDELFPLGELGVRSISVKYQSSYRTDENGNVFRFRAKLNQGSNSTTARWAYDVLLAGR